MGTMPDQVDAVHESDAVYCPCGFQVWRTEAEFRLPRVGAIVFLVKCPSCGAAVRTPDHPEWLNRSGYLVRLNEFRKRKFREPWDADEE